MLLTSSGYRAAEEEAGAVLPGGGLAAVAAVAGATIPGARFARGTLRGRPALVVWTEAAWSFAVGAPSGDAALAWAGSGIRGSGAPAPAPPPPAGDPVARPAR